MVMIENINKGNNRKSKVNLLLLIFLLSVSFIACSKDSTSKPKTELTLGEKLQNALDEGLTTYNGKGISASVIVRNEESWTGVSGVSHGTTPVTSDMLFSAGSITKTYTAAAILQLAEEELLSLDDSLHKWLPAYDNVDSTISIRQLLNHTSGIYNITENDDFWNAIFAEPERMFIPEEIITSFVLEPYFPKGTNWHYSNSGYILLRMILKEVTDANISAVYRNRFWDILNHDRSYLAVEEQLSGNVAHGWWDLDGDGTYDDFSSISRNSLLSGVGGGVFCNAEDLAKWSHALFHENNVLNQQSLEQMLTFHTPCPDEPLVAGYGLGAMQFSPELFNGMEIIGHGGNAPGFAAACLYLPNYGISIGYMDNTEEGDTMPVINDLLIVISNHFE